MTSLSRRLPAPARHSGTFQYDLIRHDADGAEIITPLTVEYEAQPGYPDSWHEPGAPDTVWVEWTPAVELTRQEKAEIEALAMQRWCDAEEAERERCSYE
jgi:hypothetical protein